MAMENSSKKQYNTIKESVLQIEKWFENNGYEGYDPYDIKAHPLFIKIAKRATTSKFFVLIRELLYELVIMFPILSRKLFSIKPQLNPKALALIVLSYQNLFKLSHKKSYMDKSDEILDLLLDCKSKTKKGIGWGYPFNWQSSEFIPSNTANGIVTTAVGEAFWQQYKLTGKKVYLDVCIELHKKTHGRLRIQCGATGERIVLQPYTTIQKDPRFNGS